MFAWANSRAAAPKSALGKAFHCLKERWPYLTNYLKDGWLEISNNRAERSIKPFVIDRKNFLFANTPKGAADSAVMFSLIQTAIQIVCLPEHMKNGTITFPKNGRKTIINAAELVKQASVSFPVVFSSYDIPFRNFYLDKCYGDSKIPLGAWMNFTSEE